MKGFVSSATAAGLKSIGFNEWCDGYYHSDSSYDGMEDDAKFEMCWQAGDFRNEGNRYRDAAPRLSEAQTWIRENFRMTIEPLWVTCSQTWDCLVGEMNDTDLGEYLGVELGTYEEALDAGIRKFIKIIQNENQGTKSEGVL